MSVSNSYCFVFLVSYYYFIVVDTIRKLHERALKEEGEEKAWNGEMATPRPRPK